MAYTPATKLPDLFITELEGYSFTSALTTTSTSGTLNKAITEQDGTVPTGKAMIIKAINAENETENIYVPVGGISADGQTVSNLVRGVRYDGLDFTTGDSSLAKEFSSGDKVVCPVNAVYANLVKAFILGQVASNGQEMRLGDETDSDFTFKWAKNGETVGFLRINESTNEVEFRDYGGAWTSFNDAVVGNLVSVSNDDTTPSYLETKLVAGDNITLTVNNGGANETITIQASSQREGIVEHATYTPASLEGGSNAETNISLWDSISDGSGRVTIDGTAYNIDGMDFTATGPLGIVTDMNEVASVIQYYVRQATGGEETVTWDTDHFEYASVDTTVDSEFSVWTTSTGTVGTDISGAGGSDWMDADSGNATVTAPVLDPTADSGKVLLLTSQGSLSAKGVTGEASVTEDDVLAVDNNGNVKTRNLPAASYLLDLDTGGHSQGASATATAYTYTIPANMLLDRLIRLKFRFAYVANTSVDIDIQLDGTSVFNPTISTGASNDFGEMQIDLYNTVSTSNQDTSGSLIYAATGGGNTRYVRELNSTTKDTTTALDLTVVVTTGASDSIDIDSFILELI